ncbi:hypothetical protein [uncultured Bacteroides sp.]|uniref:hypothetical protein n=1 Tax=uncultured Bacteroides sp. TaxID=162156 RepID=UPI002AAB2799|nr:hypothetical protein [uncultured Bacteroides sp.]
MAIKKTVLLICVTLALISCNKNFYQVYNIKSDDVKTNDNFLVYENEDCKILYNMWSEYGNPGFVLYNKTNQDLFVILSRSFYIENGIAYDYYQNQITEKSVFLSEKQNTSFSFLTSLANSTQSETYKYRNYKNKIGLSSNVLSIENPILCIPPKSSKSILKYNLRNKYEESCKQKLNHPKRKVVLSKFDKESTPLKFRNRISYSFNKDGNSTKNIDNQFWLSDITNYSQKGATKIEKIKNCKTKLEQSIKVFTISAPNKFYITYK